MHKGFMQTFYQNGDLKRYVFRSLVSEITESAFHSTGAVCDLLGSLGRCVEQTVNLPYLLT